METSPQIKRFHLLQAMIILFSILYKKTFKLLWLPILVCSLISCSKYDNSIENSISTFTLTSPEIGPDSLLPVIYTCDGESATLPLEWKGFPENTDCFAIIMHHEASATDIHWYWVVFNIPLSVNSLPENMTGIGTLGNNSVNGNIGYAPPCSQGPGVKEYIFTIYALSAPVNLSVPNSEVSRAVLLDAIKDITLESATLTVKYSRNILKIIEPKKLITH
jgi:Raf kinase inhibitor-like YbhB/YbcL family protein